jgi:tetraacyldisaccharide 4'-kinase
VGQGLLRAWERRGLWPRLLLPLSLLYYALLQLRRRLYHCRLLTSQRVDCAVIVVGNAIVGGAGKTPTTIGIVLHLQARGLQVGVVSRGYGRCLWPPSAMPLPSRCWSPTPPPKSSSATTACSTMRSTVTWRFACLMSAAAAMAGCYPVAPCASPGRARRWPVWDRTMRACWCCTPAPARPLPATGRHAQALTQDGRRIDLAGLQAPLLALAGIARPAQFFTSLRALGLVLDTTLALPDHFDFSRLDTTLLRGHQVLCTEKDAAKLWQVWPQALAIPLVQTLEPAFLQALDRLLDGVLAAKLSSRHGHQTA